MSQVGPPIPVTILSGFLGAGKTTFLNAMIHSLRQSGRRTLVIENEYGQENIDSQLVIGADSGLFEFSGGCICCDLNDQLLELLLSLWQRRTEFDELIIETTGIADPATVALPFLTNPAIADTYQLTRIICLVDARLIEFQLQDTEEARRQISFSDILLITKTEELPRDQKEHILRLLNDLHPFALVLSGNRTDGYPMEEIRYFLRYEYPEQDRLAEAIIPTENTHGGRAHTHDHHHGHEHHHHHDITSLSFRFSESFDLEELEFRLMIFLRAQPKDIYRVKGIVDAHGESQKIIVQSVAHYLGITEGQPWGKEEERVSRIVFIGRRLKPAGFEKMLRQCLFRGSDRKIKSDILP